MEKRVEGNEVWMGEEIDEGLVLLHLWLQLSFEHQWKLVPEDQTELELVVDASLSCRQAVGCLVNVG
jgi:hypothetical protein